MRKAKQLTCENCGEPYYTQERESKFCSRSCAGKFNNRNRGPLTEEHRTKISESLRKSDKANKNRSVGEKHVQAVAKATRGKFNSQCPESLLSLSSRTVSKILSRLGASCSRCGWHEATCDIHHINGRKIKDADSHTNLTLLCPNCHRLAHTGKVRKEELIPLSVYIGDKWKQFYFG